MSELKSRIKGRICLITLLFIASALLSGIVVFLAWIFGGDVEFHPIFWAVFPIFVGLYIIWYFAYKIVFETWIDEFNSKIMQGMPDEAAIKKASEKASIRPPLKTALWFAKNQRAWKSR